MCTTSKITSSVLWMIILFVLVVAAALALRFLDLGGLKHRLSAWVVERKVRLTWTAIAVRISFFNFQIITKYTQLQSIKW